MELPFIILKEFTYPKNLSSIIDTEIEYSILNKILSISDNFDINKYAKLKSDYTSPIYANFLIDNIAQNVIGSLNLSSDSLERYSRKLINNSYYGTTNYKITLENKVLMLINSITVNDDYYYITTNENYKYRRLRCDQFDNLMLAIEYLLINNFI